LKILQLLTNFWNGICDFSQFIDCLSTGHVYDVITNNQSSTLEEEKEWEANEEYCRRLSNNSIPHQANSQYTMDLLFNKIPVFTLKTKLDSMEFETFSRFLHWHFSVLNVSLYSNSHFQ
jgi:hypothetical protein